MILLRRFFLEENCFQKYNKDIIFIKIFLYTYTIFRIVTNNAMKIQYTNNIK